MNIAASAINKDVSQKLEMASFILKTVAHPLRLCIVHLLDEHEFLTVNDMCKCLEAEQSLVSHHLLKMKDKGILESKRDGRNIYYTLKLKEVTKLLECFENCNTKI